MRELKFRAWFNRFNKMIYEVDVDFLGLWKGYWDKQIHIVYPDDGDVVEQYTGLKDKNSREIYEGDIVLDYYDGDDAFVVEWDKDIASFRLTDIGNTINVSFDNYYADKELEIIGNIHENPELLEK